jgi:hypothetical protein
LIEVANWQTSFNGKPVSIVIELRTAISLVLLVGIGALSGLFVVPMNALLQHRGHVLMGAGHSIAVQNFNENLSILIMTFAYSALVSLHLHIYWIISIFGVFVASIMWLIKRRHEYNQSQYDDVIHLDDRCAH